MAWDTEKTKKLLLDAATLEFSRYGLAGARIDRIAENAGVNKERIYQYFGKKDDLFAVVLESELAAVMDAVSITGTGIDAVTGYAARVFDYQREHPAFARLVFWEGLELSAPAAEAFRTERSASKTARLREALPQLSEDDAHELLLTILTLCDGWQVLATSDRLISGTIERDDARHERRRESIVLTVEATVRAVLAR